ncbi:group II intron reverse transcriptase [Geobacillus zalihae]|uniref:RNA-dependent DNA polymerase n=2 Tax=Geobacillus TaxID=129337 RepID=A0A1V9C433_9BACL|nr:reverse transcriptase domain-containing protein [Geobacillus zalihae]OQP16367.1 RNA-dependent DNA polymerase [Geobacillus zalihae]OQP22952.1 RNA-dependent DNA polymerase [Geobacillus zalihae]QNU18512.1 RNA-dependent DNA polymerase [Geobacillus zalihae]QNU24694.1 RNA-dependent DNA polymerase [Geobacillus zalihae]
MKVNKLVVKSEQDLRNCLDLLYQEAKKGKHFYGMLELLQNDVVILEAIRNIKSNKGSKTAGIDQKIVDDYLLMPTEKVFGMIKAKLNDYKPIPVRRCNKPKGNAKSSKRKGNSPNEEGETRSLGISAVTDRIIQEMLRIVLEPIFEAQFYPHSYGFRPYRSTEHALAWMLKIINGSKLYWVVKGDIESYFDHINHKKLLNIMWNMGVRDKRVLCIVKKMLKAGQVIQGKFYPTARGIPQGGIISPLLANVYLNSFDWMVGQEYEYHPNNANYREKKNALAALRNKGHHPVFYIRYADDWVILTDTKEYAEKIREQCKQYLACELHLTLSDEKTFIADIREQRVKFLGFCIEAGKRRFHKKGFAARMIPDMEKVNAKVKEIKRDIRLLRTRKSELEKALDIENINAKIIGLANHLKIGISKYIMGKVDRVIEETAYRTWVKMYGKEKAAQYKRPVSEFHNRIDRHKGYQMKHFSVVTEDGIRVGITHAKITPIQYATVFKQEMTPYTADGRKMYEEKHRKIRLPDKMSLFDHDSIFIYILSEHNDGKYNLEYFLNRVNVFHRDKGKCKICAVYLSPGNFHCHHIDPSKPLSEINKTVNLVSLCNQCHRLVHSNQEPPFTERKMFDKLTKYRNKLKI